MMKMTLRMYNVRTDAWQTQYRASSAERAIEAALRAEPISPEAWEDGAWIIATAVDGTDSASRGR